MSPNPVYPDMKDRCQIFDTERRRWVKYDASTGSIMQIKRDQKPFARIRKQKIAGPFPES